MRRFANDKYRVFQKLWTQFDNFSVVSAIIISFWLMIHFLLYGVLNSNIRMSPFAFGFMAFFYAQILLGFNLLLGYEQASLVMIMVACFFMIELDVTSAYKHSRNVQNFFCNIVILFYVIMQFSEAMQTEADYMMDSFVMLLLGLAYFVKRSSAQKKYAR